MSLGGAVSLLILAWSAQAVAATLLCLWTLSLLRRPQPWPETPLPPVLVLVPVRGAGPGLEGFLAGLAAQDYRGPWRVAFAVEAAADPAHPVLAGFAAAHPGRAVLVEAGPARRRGQKVQNLLAALAVARRPEDVAVVTLDADTRPPPGLLARLLRPVLTGQGPIASGYRWSLPAGGKPGGEPRGELGSALVALADTAIATLPRCARCNLCWGGATAVSAAALDRLDLPRLWDRAVSDDLVMTRGARAAGLLVYAPLDVRPPSPVALPRLAEAVEFGARQYRVLRLHAPLAFALALVAAALPVAGGAAALLLAAGGSLPALLPLSGALGLQGVRAGLRAAIARRVLPAAEATQAARMLRRAWLLPLVPGFQLLCLLAALPSPRRLDWAGRRYRLDREGRVVSVEGGGTAKAG